MMICAAVMRSISPFIGEPCPKWFSTAQRELKAMQWPLLHGEMKKFFANAPHYYNKDGKTHSPLNVTGEYWPRFSRQETLRDRGLVPAAIWKNGPYQRFCLRAKEIIPHAFEEEHGHISMLAYECCVVLIDFSGRPLRISFGNKVENCVISHIETDPVQKYIRFVKLHRHEPGKITSIEIPSAVVGILACPAYMKGYEIELALPKIRCEVIGSMFPAPFLIDVSRMEYKEPFSAIYLHEIENLLPEDGSVRFHPAYDKYTQEVVWCYQAGTLPEERLPNDWIDPNFVNSRGKRIHLTFKGYWPKQ
ncbi:ribosomal l25 family protein [Cardiosporidium cionae]|uniref:Ribosomal l25 family protein n=1 Tax=Cardiosporidium cionae TaxID=476202 RepID=A0ABQ7JGH2_9APIC|nr:ribosomal l25 family protein [Cardiosporidium cionae]|eukprot:KAF8823116.1 ribosomal l25 family protein [Cardiosporidium cionae]